MYETDRRRRADEEERMHRAMGLSTPRAGREAAARYAIDLLERAQDAADGGDGVQRWCPAGSDEWRR